jgi:Zn-dependent protease with chaperone function
VGRPLPVFVFTWIIAVLPGALALYWGRGLARLIDDPVLPERLLANRTRTAVAYVVAIAVLIETAGQHFVWALPLMIVTRMAAGYPLRRVLHGETWSLASYVSFFLCLGGAYLGYWVFLGLTPWLIEIGGSYSWIVAGALALALIAWGERYSEIFRAALRARPVNDPELLTRFEAMVNACGLPVVGLEQVDMRGGVFANAVAVPSLRRPTVVVSSTLLERLDRDETSAILAHELAHIEHFNPRRLRAMRRVQYALITAAVLLSPAIRFAAPQAMSAMQLLWPIALFAAMMLQARHRQKNETASDLRALALTGDAEALIRALTKIHAFARLPRRWDAELERHASHPSLARRIQAIRAAAGTPDASLSETATFTAADGRSSVTFYDDRMVWSDGSFAGSIDYRHVTMLRVDARTSGSPRLIAVDGANRRWTMVLAPADVARAQATLDIVDTRLAAAAAPPAIPLALSRVLSVMMMLAAMFTAQVPAAVLGWIAVMMTTPSVSAAAGAAAVAGAALVWRDHSVWMTDTQPWMALALVVCGLGVIGVSIANRRERTPSFALAVAGLLCAATLGVWGAIAVSGIGLIDLHFAALEWPSAVVFPLALAGALAFASRPLLRVASAPLVLGGLAVFAVGSTGVLDRLAHDPFLPPAGAVTTTIVDGPARTEFAVPFSVSALRLSPAGGFVALDSESEDERTTIHAGAVGAALRDFAADEAIFMDEGRLLLLDRQRVTSVLRAVDLRGSPRKEWSLSVPVSWADLLFDPASGRWRLLGWNDGDIVSATGVVGDGNIHEERWTAPPRDINNVEALSISHGAVLALESHRRPRLLSGSRLWRWAAILQEGYRKDSWFWSVSKRDPSTFLSSSLDVACRGVSLGSESATCAAFDGARTGFFALDPATRQATLLAFVPGRFYLRGDAGGGWFQGRWDHEPVLLQATTRQALRLDEGQRNRLTHLAIAGRTLGAAFWSADGDGSIVRLYAID